MTKEKVKIRPKVIDKKLTDTQLDIMALVGRGLNHGRIGLQLGISTDGVRSRIYSLVRDLHLFTDRQGVLYTVQTGQLPKREVFKEAPPSSRKLVPANVPFNERVLKFLSGQAIGAAGREMTGFNPDVDRASQVVYRFRNRIGLNTDHQLLLTAIDRGELTYDDLLGIRSPISDFYKNPRWSDLAGEEQQFVKMIITGELLKTFSKKNRMPEWLANYRLSLLRRKLGADNNFQLVLNLMHDPGFELSELNPDINLENYGRLSESHFRFLNEYIRNRGGSNDYSEIASRIGRSFSWVSVLAAQIREVTGTHTTTQAALFYIDAIRAEYVDRGSVNAPELGGVMSLPA